MREEEELFRKQASYDWQKFLLMRAEELLPGVHIKLIRRIIVNKVVSFRSFSASVELVINEIKKFLLNIIICKISN